MLNWYSAQSEEFQTRHNSWRTWLLDAMRYLETDPVLIFASHINARWYVRVAVAMLACMSRVSVIHALHMATQVGQGAALL